MKIVLLESLGVSKQTIDKHKKRLERMGHEFAIYKRNDDSIVLQERVKDADVVILANMPLPADIVKKAPKLKFIDVAFTGVDHIPLEEAKERGIVVSNASSYATEAVAELAISFMIQLLRHTKENEMNCRHGKGKYEHVGNLLYGKTVGIIGAGKIGMKTAQLCKAFGCEVIVDDYKNIDIDGLRRVDLKTLLQTSDIVSLHCPLTEKTKGMIGKKQFSWMKKTAYLINTARGNIIDMHALVDALAKEEIAGAAVDVFDIEPPLPENHPYLHVSNMIVTPHIGYSTIESMEKRAEIVFDNLYAWLEGKAMNRVE